MEANRKQAMVPEGAIALDPVGTAPGLVVPAGERVVIVLPGPPRELQPMWPVALATEPVREVLARATPLRGYTLRMFGVPESEIAKSLREIEGDGADDRRGRDHHLPAPRRDRDRRPLPRRGRGGRRRGARRAWRSATGAISSASTARRSTPRSRSCWRAGGWAWPSPAAAACWRRGSPTSRAPRPTWPGSVVAYSNEAKAELLGVDPALIEAKGAVSPEVAEAMAIGALERFGADVAVSITGIAGPDGGTEEKPVGYVCFNARLADGTAIAREPVIPGGRDDIRERSALVGMHLLRILLSGAEPPL